MSFHGKCMPRKMKRKIRFLFFLHCSKKDKSSNWIVAAEATIQLLPVDGVNDALVHHISSFVFGSLRHTYGYPILIGWDHLLKIGSKFVRDDTIKLKMEIMAENPNDVNRSILKFETIDKSCDCGSTGSSHWLFDPHNSSYVV